MYAVAEMLVVNPGNHLCCHFDAELHQGAMIPFSFCLRRQPVNDQSYPAGTSMPGTFSFMYLAIPAAFSG